MLLPWKYWWSLRVWEKGSQWGGRRARFLSLFSFLVWMLWANILNSKWYELLLSSVLTAGKLHLLSPTWQAPKVAFKEMEAQRAYDLSRAHWSCYDNWDSNSNTGYLALEPESSLLSCVCLFLPMSCCLSFLSCMQPQWHWSQPSLRHLNNLNSNISPSTVCGRL